MNEEFEEWFEKYQEKIEFDFIEQNWEDLRNFARDVYEVDKDIYNDDTELRDDYTKYQR
jgi:hypothetical protein